MNNNFEELKVWQKAHQLVLELYKTTKEFPLTEISKMISSLINYLKKSEV